MKAEYDGLSHRGTFKEISQLPSGTKIIPVTWVYRYKFDVDGILIKYKARLCVRRDLQPTPLRDTYAATLASRTFRAIAAIVASFDLETRQLDAVSAFTNSPLDEPIYIKAPEGLNIPVPNLLLLRALYGLRQSPRLWLEQLTSILISVGLHPVSGHECLFQNEWHLLFFYVDDLVSVFRKEDTPKHDTFLTDLRSKLEVRDLGEWKWFLGVRIVRDREVKKLWLCQDSYIEKMATDYRLDTMPKFPDTPMTTDELPLPASIEPAAQDIHKYQRRVGSLIYASIITRPDISRAVSRLSEAMLRPTQAHQDAANRAISYLYGTRFLALEYSSPESSLAASQAFTASSDASFADDQITRRSSEGYLFSLFGAPIDWTSRRQKTVTTSTTEAELLALTHVAQQLSAWSRFFASISLTLDQSYSLRCDNLQTLRLVTKQSPQISTRLRHIDVHQHWLRQEVDQHRLSVVWVPTGEMAADGFTKSLTRDKHRRFLAHLSLVDVRHRIEPTHHG